MKEKINRIINNTLAGKCENLHIVLLERKEARHLTNQDIADAINVPVDRVRKFFAGELKNPNVFSVMALCMFFEVSLDTLLGNPYGNASGKDARIAQLEQESQIAELKLEHAKETIQHLKKSLKYISIIACALLCLCVVMVLAL